jgi:legumain
MTDKKMYKEMVFYIESCESGSMFPDLDESSNVYAMTASNAELSSWAAYCGRDAKVDGKKLGTCLGDLFSVNWM